MQWLKEFFVVPEKLCSFCIKMPQLSAKRMQKTFKKPLPGDSKWPFDHLVGGHLTKKRVTSPSQKGHFESPGEGSFVDPKIGTHMEAECGRSIRQSAKQRLHSALTMCVFSGSCDMDNELLLLMLVNQLPLAASLFGAKATPCCRSFGLANALILCNLEVKLRQMCLYHRVRGPKKKGWSANWRELRHFPIHFSILFNCLVLILSWTSTYSQHIVFQNMCVFSGSNGYEMDINYSHFSTEFGATNFQRSLSKVSIVGRNDTKCLASIVHPSPVFKNFGPPGFLFGEMSLWGYVLGYADSPAEKILGVCAVHLGGFSCSDD